MCRYISQALMCASSDKASASLLIHLQGSHLTRSIEWMKITSPLPTLRRTSSVVTSSYWAYRNCPLLKTSCKCRPRDANKITHSKTKEIQILLPRINRQNRIARAMSPQQRILASRISRMRLLRSSAISSNKNQCKRRILTSPKYQKCKEWTLLPLTKRKFNGNQRTNLWKKTRNLKRELGQSAPPRSILHLR